MRRRWEDGRQAGPRGTILSGLIAVGFALLPLTVLLWAIPATALPVAPAGASTSAKPMATGEHRVVLNGTGIWYRVAGRENAGEAPVLFLHGGPGEGSQVFATIAGPLLERRHRMTYLGQRGSGRSERPASRDYRTTTLVAEIEALRRHLGVPRTAIIGHSF